MQWPTLLLQNFSNARTVTSLLCKVASSRGAGKIKRNQTKFWLQSVGRLWSQIDEEQQVYKTLCVLLRSCSTLSGVHTIFKGASREQGIEQVANMKSEGSSSVEGCTAASSTHSNAGCARGCRCNSRCPTGNCHSTNFASWTGAYGALGITHTGSTTLILLRISEVFKNIIFTLGTP